MKSIVEISDEMLAFIPEIGHDLMKEICSEKNQENYEKVVDELLKVYKMGIKIGIEFFVEGLSDFFEKNNLEADEQFLRDEVDKGINYYFSAIDTEYVRAKQEAREEL